MHYVNTDVFFYTYVTVTLLHMHDCTLIVWIGCPIISKDDVAETAYIQIVHSCEFPCAKPSIVTCMYLWNTKLMEYILSNDTKAKLKCY